MGNRVTTTEEVFGLLPLSGLFSQRPEGKQRNFRWVLVRPGQITAWDSHCLTIGLEDARDLAAAARRIPTPYTSTSRVTSPTPRCFTLSCGQPMI